MLVRGSGLVVHFAAYLDDHSKHLPARQTSEQATYRPPARFAANDSIRRWLASARIGPGMSHGKLQHVKCCCGTTLQNRPTPAACSRPSLVPGHGTRAHCAASGPS